MDIHSGSSSYKFSYSVEIAPICRDDLVVLPKIGPPWVTFHVWFYVTRSPMLFSLWNLILCNSRFISSSVLEISFPIVIGCYTNGRVYCINIEPTGDIRGKYVLADIEVSRASDLGSNDQTFYVRTHLGGIYIQVILVWVTI